MQKLLVIVGPTASGKSDLAVEIARLLDGEIVSADSRQVYKGLDIGSGKITKKEMRGVPHHLLDVVSPKKTFSVSDYQKQARKAVEKIWNQNKLPIIVGGTGFYIDALVDGIILPEVAPDKKLRADLSKKTPAELFSILKKLDKNRADNIDSQNPHRLIRAIEIATHLGKVPKIKTNPLRAETTFIGLTPNQDDLKNKIHTRLQKRIRAGMIKEVKDLHKQGVSWKRLEELGLEYKYVALFLQKKISKGEMIDELETAINQYAKRQMTWFRRNKKIKWFADSVEVLNFVNKELNKT